VRFGVFGVQDIAGFDELRYTNFVISGTRAPAFDNVNAQYIGGSNPPAAVPEPST